MIDRTVRFLSVSAILACTAFFAACSHSSATTQQQAQASATMSAAPLVRSVSLATAQAGSVMRHSPAPRVALATPASPQAQAKTVASSPQTAAHVAAPAATESLRGVVIRSAHAAPKIVRIVLPNPNVTSGEVVRASVYTTSNTASVEARLYNYGMALQRVGVGHFRLVYQVPDIPFYLKRSWPVQVIARNADGRTSSQELTISVR